MSHSWVAAGRSTGQGAALLGAAPLGAVGRQRSVRAAGGGVRWELRAALRSRRDLRAALRAGGNLVAGCLGVLPLRGEALGRLRAARVLRRLRARGAPGGRAVRPLRVRCGMLALRLWGRTEQVLAVTGPRLERSSVWAVLGLVRMGTDRSLRRL
ncbi:hypothetical protein H4W79_004353 [Nocardiopsis terrae]|uniref:Uncharacterized protein n=1 Tax=Nocardiopsis terrae TaxID=372655 RepID=A0ABR9HMA6_9ACTN|nr:hypothetical protein [Nocardiopsis terrae]MBE1460139.1 hypothetical protein [Nocardiopsis terrae]